MRLGQTEVGSFVVQIFCRVPPALEDRPDLFPDTVPSPYERSVTETLARSLDALDRAVAAGGAISKFESTIPDGVSANLCEALAGMQHEDQKITIALSWAPARQPMIQRRSEFSFGPSSLAVAGRLFRANSSSDFAELTGFVIKLDRRINARRGTIGLQAKVGDYSKTIFIRLEQMEYSQAVQAHNDKLVVSCAGTLEKTARGLRLRYLSSFVVHPADDR